MTGKTNADRGEPTDVRNVDGAAERGAAEAAEDVNTEGTGDGEADVSLRTQRVTFDSADADPTAGASDVGGRAGATDGDDR